MIGIVLGGGATPEAKVEVWITDSDGGRKSMVGVSTLEGMKMRTMVLVKSQRRKGRVMERPS